MDNQQWLLFIPQYFDASSKIRVTVWRKLRNAGAITIQNAVWILPDTKENLSFMNQLAKLIKEGQGQAHIFKAQGVRQKSNEEMVALFNSARELEYIEFLEQSKALITEIEKEINAKKFTFAELEENEQNMQRLRKWLTTIQKRDFFNTTRSLDANEAIHKCEDKLQGFSNEVYIHEGI